MYCDKCDAAKMAATKVWRLSGCLVAIGFTLLVPSLIVLGIVVLTTIVGFSAVSEHKAPPTEEEVTRFAALDGMQAAVVEDFRVDGEVSPKILSGLAADSRRRAEEIIQEHADGVAGVKGVAAVIGGGMAVFVYALFLPMLIIGFFLVLRRKIWRCTSCGHAFDRV